MAFSYLVMITKSHIAKLMAQVTLKFGTVTHFWFAALYWVKQKLSHIIMRTGNCVSQVWIIDPAVLALLLDVINKSNTPIKNVTGFQRSGGRWFIRLKNIGWLRVSDVLQMAIEIYPTHEEVK
jgi:ABC-type transporter Mla MlaB component